MRALIVALCGCALWLFASGSAQAQRDQIDPVTGPQLTGTITKVSPTEVEIDARGGVKQVAVNEIESISFTDEPMDLRTGRNRALAGQLEDGLALLGRIPAESLSSDLVKADLEFYRAYCQARLSLTGGGDKNAAAKALIDFVNARPQSFHYFEACQLIGDLAFAMGRFSAAMEYYQRIAKAPWPEYQMRARVLEARALVAQSQFAEALQRYDDVLKMPLDTAAATREKLLAQIGRAVCLAETGKPDEAQQIVEGIIRDNDPQDAVLFARAYNALGLAHLKAQRSKDALLAYLHVDLLFNSDADAHAEALYQLGQLWTTVGQSERAVEARSLLKSRYAGSPWAAK